MIPSKFSTYKYRFSNVADIFFFTNHLFYDNLFEKLQVVDYTENFSKKTPLDYLSQGSCKNNP